MNADVVVTLSLDGLPWFLPSFSSDGGNKRKGDMQRMMCRLPLSGSLEVRHISCHEWAVTAH